MEGLQIQLRPLSMHRKSIYTVELTALKIAQLLNVSQMGQRERKVSFPLSLSCGLIRVIRYSRLTD